ncbi:ROK family protein [Streptomyces sp. NRRL B-24572]|uniref:ROK family protein n=1 Tax=Streptomyces sp. NRRL B-24572 TaxID=1962156 RepID=UPI000A3C3013|nr:ROK family protein [Streptomyces sp. NRRL B-24572]
MTTSHVLALDVGGTGIKGALLDPDDRATATLSCPTPRGQGPQAVLRAITDTANALLRRAGKEGLDVAHAGVVVPGIVDDGRGHVIYSANLGFRDEPLSVRLTDGLGLPVTVGHDVRAAALAESSLGAAAGRRHTLFMALGTGIAGAFITDGHVLHSDGWAGEIGHLTIDPHGRDCACGSRGCLETIASARAVAEAFTRRTGIPVGGAADVADRLLDGDPNAREVWARAVDALAQATAVLTTVLGPDTVVVGGGLGDAGELLLAPLREALADRLTFHRRPEIVTAALGSRAGCVGAGLIARGASARS